jgi:hypothetical protein
MMRSRIWSVLIAIAFAGCVSTAGRSAAAAVEAPPEAGNAPPTPTEEDKILLKTLLLHVSAEPDYGPAPLTVQFTVEHFATDNPVKPKYTWDFGDGSKKSQEQNPKHTYKKPGKYKAIIKVTDAVGQAGQDDLQIDVGKAEDY